MKTELGNQIHALLRRHVGEDHCITSAELAAALGLPASAQRRVREVIAAESSLWSDIIVCGFGGLGFFCCADIEEAIRYRDWLLGTFTEIGEKIEGFEKHCRAHGLRVPPPMDELRERAGRLGLWLDKVFGPKARRAA